MSFYFWSNWKRFSKFDFERPITFIDAIECKYSSKDEYTWSWCLKKSLLCNLELHLFGVTIEQSWEFRHMKHKRLSIQSKWNQTLEELDNPQKEKILDELGCPICLELIDMTANLQCLKWKHMFCFYCLINHLKVSEHCPYCKCSVTTDTLGTDTNLISTFNQMVEAERVQGTLWELHEQKCYLYWKTCGNDIWWECILSDKHKVHEIASIKTLSKETKDLWEELSKPENSIQLLLEKKIDNLNESKYIL